MKTRAYLAAVGVIALSVGSMFPVRAADPVPAAAPVVVPADLSNVAPKDLGELSKQLRDKGEERASDLKKVAVHAAERYSAAKTAAGGASRLNWEDWQDVVIYAGAQMPDAMKAELFVDFKQAFAADAVAVNKLDEKMIIRVGATFNYLGKADESAKVYDVWIRGAEGYKTASANTLFNLANILKFQGPEWSDTRKVIAKSVQTRFLVDRVSAAKVTPQEWWRLSRFLEADLDAAAKQKWIDTLRSAYAPDVAATGNLNAADLYWLSNALQVLKDSEACPAAVALENSAGWRTWEVKDYLQLAKILKTAGDPANNARYLLLGQLPKTVLATASWKEFKPDQLDQLFKLLDGHSEETKSARQQVTAHLVSTMLKDEASTRKLTIEASTKLVNGIQRDVTPDVRQWWAQRLKSAYAPDDATTAGIYGVPMKMLVDTLEDLDADVAADVARSWLAAGRTDASVAITAQVATVACKSTKIKDADKAALIASLDAKWSALEPAKISSGDAVAAAHACGVAGDRARQVKWAMQAYKRTVVDVSADKVSLGALGPLGHFLEDESIVEPGKGFPEFARAVAALAKGGKLTSGRQGKLAGTGWQLRKLAYPLGDADCRGVVEAELVDGKGLVRMEVAKIMAWAYRYHGKLPEWIDRIDRELEAAKNKPDVKAQWLVIKGYSVSLKPHLVDATLGKDLRDKALATAESEGMKVEMLREMSIYYIEIGQFDAGMGMLESVRDQYASVEAKTKLDYYIADLQNAKAAVKDRVAVKLDNQQRKQQEDLLAHYKKRLVIVQSEKDVASAGRLQAAIRDLETKLKE